MSKCVVPGCNRFPCDQIPHVSGVVEYCERHSPLSQELSMSDMHHFDLLSNAIKRLNTAMRCFHVPANVGKLAWGKRQGEWAIFLRHKDQWIRFADANLEQRLANVENLKELIDVLHDTQAERADQIEEAAMEIAAMAESLEDTTDAV